jgi:hypothetical protein
LKVFPVALGQIRARGEPHAEAHQDAH